MSRKQFIEEINKILEKASFWVLDLIYRCALNVTKKD